MNQTLENIQSKFVNTLSSSMDVLTDPLVKEQFTKEKARKQHYEDQLLLQHANAGLEI